MSEFVDPPQGGRTFSIARRPLLGDCAPSGRLRLDALARMLQDVAYLDVDDAGVADLAVWVVRRSRVQVRRFPQFGEELTLTTFCSGLGRAWAERRTTVRAAAGDDAVAEAVSMWVHLDPVSWRPAPFTPEELRLYGDAAAGRKVSARLRHAAPGDGEPTTSWRFRAVDCDVAAHVNNAAYWQPVEEQLLSGNGAAAEPLTGIDAEIEFRTPAQPGEMAIVGGGDRRWIQSGTGETHASIVINAIAIAGGAGDGRFAAS